MLMIYLSPTSFTFLVGSALVANVDVNDIMYSSALSPLKTKTCNPKFEFRTQILRKISVDAIENTLKNLYLTLIAYKL